MTIKDAQDKINEFDKARGWEDNWNIKDLLLNITEEGGEFWNLIKWVDDEKQNQILNENKREVENYIGDTLFLLLKIANQTKVDSEKAPKCWFRSICYIKRNGSYCQYNQKHERCNYAIGSQAA